MRDPLPAHAPASLSLFSPTRGDGALCSEADGVTAMEPSSQHPGDMSTQAESPSRFSSSGIEEWSSVGNSPPLEESAVAANRAVTSTVPRPMVDIHWREARPSRQQQVHDIIEERPMQEIVQEKRSERDQQCRRGDLPNLQPMVFSSPPGLSGLLMGRRHAGTTLTLFLSCRVLTPGGEAYCHFTLFL